MRLTIDYGIDLGTTNSAVAVQAGAAPRLLPDAAGNLLLPSAIHLDTHGQAELGELALARRVTDPANTSIEFKRLMGTNAPTAFPACGKSFLPEELSAMILRSLAARVQAVAGERLRAAVVTVPAMFQIPQCDATRKAAALAGIEYAPLLQEPIAAAIAHAGTGTVKDGYWLVYDLGGGTFDVSLVRSKAGRLQVLDHDGDNQLGGKDFNRALARKAAELVRSEGNLGSFSRSDPALADAFTKLNAVAEQARIRLSSVEQTELVVDRLAQTASGDWVGVRMSIDRGELQSLLAPIVQRTIELCRKLLARNQLAPRELHGMVLVGGPTRTPFLAPLLEQELGVDARQTADPTTIVAAGAALFASTQKLPPAWRSAPGERTAGELSLRLEFEAMTTNARPLLVGHLEGAADSPASYHVQVTSDDGSYDSGRIAVNPQGAFSASLGLQKGQLNSFNVHVYRGSDSVPASPHRFNILHGLSVGKPPLSQSVGVMLADNSTRWYLRKGESLPARKTVTHATTQLLRRGQSADAIHVPLVQGENERADRNKVIGILHIRAEKLARDLPAGSEIEVTMEVDEFSNASARAYVPLLDTWFDHVVSFQMETKERTEVARGLASQKDRLAQLQQLSQSLEAGSGTGIDDRLRQVEELIDEGDSDSVQLAEQLVRVATSELDAAEKQADYQRLTNDFNERVANWREILRDDGKAAEQQELEELIREFYLALEHKDEQLAQQKRERCEELVRNVLHRTPGFWVGMLYYLIEQIQQHGLAELAQHDIQAGLAAAQRQDINGVVDACCKLYERLPRDEKEKIPLGAAAASLSSHIT